MLKKKTVEAYSAKKFKESIEWSFPKAKRFKPVKRQHTPEFNDLPSTFSDRACGFGVGRRWSPINLAGKDAPSPGAYESPSSFGRKNKGPSFKRRYYKFANHQWDKPGPGAYNPYSPIGNRGPKFTFRQRLLKSVRSSTPPPNTYRPSYKITEKAHFSNISFGKGERSQVYGKLEIGPGPGTYDIPSSFCGSASRCSSAIHTARARTPM